MKDKIILYLKVFLLVWPATLGYLFIYMLAWDLLGLPTEWWSGVILTALACLSEYGFIRWAGRMDNGIKYWLLCKLLGNMCENSQCNKCSLRHGGGCYQAEVHEQGRKAWKIGGTGNG